MFGGFDKFDLTAGFSELGERLQKFKDDVEHSIDASIRLDRFGVPIDGEQAAEPAEAKPEAPADAGQSGEHGQRCLALKN